MRAPMRWLRAYCDPPVSTGEAGKRLNDAGIELERIDRVGVGALDNFVVGRVLKAEQHPNADRLSVCVVDDGSGDERTIVCGAPNVAAGQTVALALPGAVMPDGTQLGEAKLRGVESSGMILAEDEVGVGEDHDGIMVLAESDNGGPAPGTPLIEALQIQDEVLDLAIAPNRPDCLAVYGVARELHALTEAPLAPDPTDEDVEPAATGEGELPQVEIDPEICLRFTVRVFEDVRIGPSPLWLKARLTAAGQRPISNVVDITNYVMLLTGQPLHAFDLDKVRGGRLRVHRAEDGQKMRTLDGVERTLDSTMALISDAEGPTSIAGVMGGEVSEVSDTTTRVAMEAAIWVGANIMRTQAKLGLRSEASARNEKGLHPDLALAAQRLAARLMVDLCGARMVEGTVDEYPAPAEPRTVGLRSARVEKLLGMAVADEEIAAILERLGFDVEPANGGFEVTVPYWRDGDVQREADLVEEVARIHGLDKLPRTLPARRQAVGRLTPAQRVRRRVEDALRDRGMSEVVAYSFTAPEKLEDLRLGDVPVLRLANPMSEDQSVMRPLLLPGLLDAARHNAAHGRPLVALFESAHVYRVSDAPETVGEGSPGGRTAADEHHHLGGVLTEATPGTWRREPRPADFYAAKALVETLLGAVGLTCVAEPGERPFLHPGRTATVLAAGRRELGWIGELHPSVARAWDLDGTVAAFELDADLIAELAPGPQPYRDVTSFPAVLQDIAVTVDDGVPAVEVERVVRGGG